VYEGEVERSINSKIVMGINIIRALIYFLVVGVQVVHCTTEVATCGAMIILVPLILGVMDSLLIWISGRESMGVLFGGLVLSIISAMVAIDTLAPILYSVGPVTDYMTFMAYLSLGVIIMSAMEIIVLLFALFSPKGNLEELRFSTSTRTYEN
jgi:hypothetical protein